MTINQHCTEQACSEFVAPVGKYFVKIKKVNMITTLHSHWTHSLFSLSDEKFQTSLSILILPLKSIQMGVDFEFPLLCSRMAIRSSSCLMTFRRLDFFMNLVFLRCLLSSLESDFLDTDCASLLILVKDIGTSSSSAQSEMKKD